MKIIFPSTLVIYLQSGIQNLVHVTTHEQDDDFKQKESSTTFLYLLYPYEGVKFDPLQLHEKEGMS